MPATCPAPCWKLVRLHRKTQELKGKVRLCVLRPPVMDAFKVSQFIAYSTFMSMKRRL